MARPAVVVALPKGESGPVVVRAGRRRVRSPRGRLARRPRNRARQARRHRRRHPRRRDRLRRVARVLLRPPRRRPVDPGPDGRLLALVRPAGHGCEGGRRGRVPDPPLLRRVDPLADRGDVHPQPDRRRRQRAHPPERADDARGLEPAGHDRRRLQPEGRRRQDDDRDEPRLDPADPSRPARPAGRCRHGHGPRLHLAGHRRRADGLRQLAATRPRAAASRR